MPGIPIDPAFRKCRTEANEVAKVMLSDECDRRTAASLFIAWQAIQIFLGLAPHNAPVAFRTQ
jgi:hypothetical protein